MIEQLPPDQRDRRFGFNVIGNVSSNSGLGVHARILVTLLLQKGCPVTILDLDPGLQRQGYDSTFGSYTVETPTDLPHGVNFFVLQPPALFATIARFPEVFLATGKLNVGLVMWELAVLPRAWLPALKALDVVAAASEFCGSTFAAHLSNVATISVPCPIAVPESVQPSRRRFGLPERGLLFATSFEPNSDIQRKNPFAAVETFLRAFGDEQRAHLVIKLNNANRGETGQSAVRELLRRCGGHATIHVFNEVLTYSEVLSLYASCDAFVSLHRSEGLGLALMEAMALGKPVIATGWSGNMTYMNHTNSCLVGYDLVPVEGDVPVYRKEFLGREALWANPRLDEAVAWMRLLADDQTMRQSIGEKAASDMKHYREVANEAAFIDEIRAIWSQRAFMPLQEERRSIPVACFWDAASTQPASVGQRLKKSILSAGERHLFWRFRSPR